MKLILFCLPRSPAILRWREGRIAHAPSFQITTRAVPSRLVKKASFNKCHIFGSQC